MSDEFIDLDLSPSLSASVLELQDLRLVRSTWEMTGRSTAPPLAFKLEPQLGYSCEDALVVFEVSHHFEVTSRDDATVAVVEAGVTYQVAYRRLSDVQLRDEDLQAFGDATVFLTVHPFLRELLRSFTSNSGLPPLVIPLLRTRINPVAIDGPQSKSIGKATSASDTSVMQPPNKEVGGRQSSENAGD